MGDGTTLPSVEYGGDMVAAGAGTPVARKRQRGDGGDERDSVDKCGTDCASAGPKRAASWATRPAQWLTIEDGSVTTVATPQVPEGVDQGAGSSIGQKRAVSGLADTAGNLAAGEGLDVARKRRPGATGVTRGAKRWRRSWYVERRRESSRPWWRGCHQRRRRQ